jgi:hypothetical protein
MATGLISFLRELPRLNDLRAYRERFEVERMVFAESNRIVANATLDLLLAMYIPRYLNRLGRPVVLALCENRLAAAIGRKASPTWLKVMVAGVMGLRARVLRLLPENRSLRLITQRRTPTYPAGYEIARLGTFPVATPPVGPR